MKNGDIMKKLFKNLTEITQDSIERLIAEKCDNDEQIESILDYNRLIKEEKALIDDQVDISIDELVDNIKGQKYFEVVNDLINESLDVISPQKLNDIEFMIRVLITKINMFSTTVSTQYIKELVLPFFNAQKSNDRLLIKYHLIDNDLYRMSKEIEVDLLKLLLATSKLDDIYNKCLVLLKEISMYIILGEFKLKKIIVDDMSKLHNQDVPDESQIKQIEELTKESNRLENAIFNLKQFRIQIIMLIKNVFFILFGTDKLIEKIYISTIDIFKKWKVKTSMVIEDKSVKKYNGKMTEYSDAKTINTVALIDIEDIETMQNNQTRKKAIILANKELRLSLSEILEVSIQKINQIKVFKDRIHIIEAEPQDI